MLKQKNSKKQGDVGLGLAIAHFSSLGYTVSIPLTDSQAYDLLVDNGEIRKVQVKTTTEKNPYGRYQVELRTLGGNQSYHTQKKFDPTAVDLVFIVTEEGTKYLIPATRITARSRVSLGESTKEFKI